MDTESGRPSLPGGRTIAGYALQWGVPSRVRPGYEEVFHSDSLTWPDDLPACVNHDKSHIIGRLGHDLRLTVDAVGLWVELDPSDYEYVAGVRSGRFTAWSISFLAASEAWSDVDGEKLRTVHKARLLEVSLCDRGAHKTTLGLGSRPDMWAHNRRNENVKARQSVSFYQPE